MRRCGRYRCGVAQPLQRTTELVLPGMRCPSTARSLASVSCSSRSKRAGIASRTACHRGGTCRDRRRYTASLRYPKWLELGRSKCFALRHHKSLVPWEHRYNALRDGKSFLLRGDEGTLRIGNLLEDPTLRLPTPVIRHRATATIYAGRSLGPAAPVRPTSVRPTSVRETSYSSVLHRNRRYITPPPGRGVGPSLPR